MFLTGTCLDGKEQGGRGQNMAATEHRAGLTGDNEVSPRNVNGADIDTRKIQIIEIWKSYLGLGECLRGKEKET